ncbi:MAG: hypothetical protein VX379_02980 [Pseudomonadota bacterium]|uniref:hypothetical protein n=1 Tax=Alcanivorax sp. TaxID=1872427 RepID=UPI00243CF4BA|nr:hypothetical protein [Alcanivorax sp.]MED5238519.1 hypothetical protein [Pseudomonadota bacterium]MEE3319195.1 hypothetical protein [Pseudomonadota bacterium]
MEKLATISPAAPVSVARVMQVQAVAPQVRLRCEETGEQVVAAEVALLPAPLSVQDRVLVQSTLQGWVVTSLLGGGSTPAMTKDADGRLLLNCEKGIRLQVGDACIDISVDGCITVDGREVHTLASGLQRILGATVQIN